MNYVVDTVTTSVDCNRASAVSLREFVTLLEEAESDYSEIIYHANFIVFQYGVCLLKQFFVSFKDIKLFIEKLAEILTN
jgi:hypothetical protein